MVADLRNVLRCILYATIMAPEPSRVECFYVRGDHSAKGLLPVLEKCPDRAEMVPTRRRTCAMMWIPELAQHSQILHNDHTRVVCFFTYAVALLLRIFDHSATATPLHAPASRPMTVAERCNAPTQVHHAVEAQGSLAFSGTSSCCQVAQALFANTLPVRVQLRSIKSASCNTKSNSVPGHRNRSVPPPAHAKVPVIALVTVVGTILRQPTHSCRW